LSLSSLSLRQRLRRNLNLSGGLISGSTMAVVVLLAAEAAGFPGNVEQAIGSVLGLKVLVAL